MELPGIEFPPLSPGSSSSAEEWGDDWFAITREDLPPVFANTESDSGGDIEGDFVLIASESDTKSEVICPSLLAAVGAAPSPIVCAIGLPSRPANPGMMDTPPIPTAPSLIVIGDRKITRPGFHTDHALAFDDRWIGRDTRFRRRPDGWWGCRCCRRDTLGQFEVYPLADPVFPEHRRHPRVNQPDAVGLERAVEPTPSPPPPPPPMEVRVVDAAEELAYRLVREATRPPQRPSPVTTQLLPKAAPEGERRRRRAPKSQRARLALRY